jgi:hypothetical protein
LKQYVEDVRVVLRSCLGRNRHAPTAAEMLHVVRVAVEATGRENLWPIIADLAEADGVDGARATARVAVPARRQARRKLDRVALDKQARKALRRHKTFPIAKLARILKCSTGVVSKLGAWRDHMKARVYRRVKVMERLTDVITDNAPDTQATNPRDEAIARLTREQEAEHEEDHTPGYERS